MLKHYKKDQAGRLVLFVCGPPAFSFRSRSWLFCLCLAPNGSNPSCNNQVRRGLQQCRFDCAQVPLFVYFRLDFADDPAPF